MTRKKILLLYASFGGGHFAPAKALAQQLAAEHPEYSVTLVDICDFVPHAIAEQSRWWYSWAVSSARWSYSISYWFNSLWLVAWVGQWWMYFLCRTRLQEFLNREQPDGVVMFHFLGWGVERMVRAQNLQTFFAYVVTDPFSPHRFWFMSKTAQYLVFSQTVARVAQQYGIRSENIVVTEPFIRQEFTDTIALQPTAPPTVLILSGGAGIRSFNALIDGLLALPSKPKIVIAGLPSSQLPFFNTLRAACGERLAVYGFIDNIRELMSMSQVLIGKAGASSTMEALYLKKPHILIDYIWGQEAGTKDWLVENKLGWYEPDFKKVPALVAKILNNDAEVQPVLQAIGSYTLQNGAVQAARFIEESLRGA